MYASLISGGPLQKLSGRIYIVLCTLLLVLLVVIRVTSTQRTRCFILLFPEKCKVLRNGASDATKGWFLSTKCDFFILFSACRFSVQWYNKC